MFQIRALCLTCIILFTAHQNPVTLYNPIMQMVNNCVPNYLKMEWNKISLKLHLKELDSTEERRF